MRLPLPLLRLALSHRARPSPVREERLALTKLARLAKRVIAEGPVGHDSCSLRRGEGACDCWMKRRRVLDEVVGMILDGNAEITMSDIIEKLDTASREG